MSGDEYRRIRAMNYSSMKVLRQSPAHFYGMYLDKSRPPWPEPTAAMKNGTLVHCAIFEPDQVAARYVVKPDGMSFATKEGKAWRDANSDREPVDAAQMAAALAQAAALRRLPEVAALLSDGYGEASAFWIDQPTGELCKCRPDWTSPAGDGVVLLDGKTCQDASAEGFSRTIWNFDYWLQAAWYSDGFEAATGLHVHGFVFAAVESEWPHAAAAYVLGDDVLDRARAENRRLLDLYAECKRTGQWPGYSQRISLINLPAWAKDRTNEL